MFKKNIPNTKYQILNTIVTDHSGVTLLELMVAVALFALTIVMASGIFQSVVNSQRQAIISQNMQENMRYSLEKMGKEVRTAMKDKTLSCIPTGSIYWVGGGTSGNRLEFLNYHNKCVCYYLNAGRLMVSGQGCSGGLPLTPQKITVSNLLFNIKDAAADQQALVNLRMHINVSVPGTLKEDMDIQTSLSSRFYE